MVIRFSLRFEFGLVYTVVNNKSLPTYCVMQERVCFFPRDKKKCFFEKREFPLADIEKWIDAF